MKSAEAIKYRYVILGAGRSGIGMAKLLKKRGASVFLSDSSPEEKLLYLSKDGLVNNNIDFETGSHSDRVFDCDIIIKSPGIPPHSEIILNARKKGICVISEIEAAFWFCPCPIVAVSGTNGKTTTTVLTGEMFRNAGYDTHVCGNVGLAFSEVIDNLNENSVVIIETSSFQLFDIIDFKPKVSLLLNLTPDHIDWHGSINNYLKSKLNLNKNQNSGDWFAYNFDDKRLYDGLKKVILSGKISAFGFNYENIQSEFESGCYEKNSELIYFDRSNNISEKVITSDGIKLRGRHNIYNSMAAVIAAKSFGIDRSVIEETLAEFKGVEHRIEFVRELNGVDFYNDSKATNFDSTYVALESFPSNIILILGGKKGENNFPLIEKSVRERVKFIAALGQTREDIKEYFSKFKEVVVCETMSDAVRNSFKNAEAGDIILFSPAYKSFDMFDNFEQRGRIFKEEVNLL